MPSQDRLRRDDRRKLIQKSTAEGHPAHGEPAAVGVGQPESPAAKLAFEDAVLLEKVVENALLVAVEPAGEDDGENVEHGRHGAREGSDLTPVVNQII